VHVRNLGRTTELITGLWVTGGRPGLNDVPFAELPLPEAGVELRPGGGFEANIVLRRLGLVLMPPDLSVVAVLATGEHIPSDAFTTGALGGGLAEAYAAAHPLEEPATPEVDTGKEG
jgi:hypothetical protein